MCSGVVPQQPPTPPPPLLPPPPPTPASVVVTVTASGSVSDYQDTSALQRAFAAAADAMQEPVAAAVAALVVINGGVFEQSNDASFVAGAPDAVRLAPVNIAPVMYEQATPRDHQRQHGLMLRHIQSRAMNQPGVASFAKVATFRSPSPPEEKQGAERRPGQ